MRNVFGKICRENQNTNFMFSNTFFFREIVPFMKQYGKSGSAEQATDDNMAHVRFMLGI